MTENYRSGLLVPAVLASATVLFLVILAMAVLATGATPPGWPGAVPSDNYVEVLQGRLFELKGSITFDNEATGYFIWGPIYWYHSGNADENFTVGNVSVYWSDNTPVENVYIDDYEIPNGHQIEISDNATAGGTGAIDPNGTFYVDIWLRAASGDGTSHRLDNQDIYFSMGIILYEPGPHTVSAGPITVGVIGRGVKVLISPDNQSAVPCTTLDYTVTVKNTGNMGSDNYDLIVSDTENWGDNISLDNTLLAIPENENRTTTLHVHIPEDASGEDNITVTAISQGDNTKSDNASCIAHVKMREVNVSISPNENDGLSGENVTFTVMVTNIGAFEDNYTLEVSDGTNWNPMLDNENFYNVGPGENRQTTLTVSIPPTAVGGDSTTITVTATSQVDNRVSDNDSCIARVVVNRRVQVTISPDYADGPGDTTLDYTVTVQNKGNVDDTYDLSVGDSMGWGPEISLDDSSLRVAHGDENSTTLHVHIPREERPCTEDRIIVTATSQDNDMIHDSDSCIAHVAIPHGVGVSISPSEDNAFSGENVTFAVKITNTGGGVDNYDLDARDDLGWALSLADNLLGDVMLGETRTTTLTVTIPENTEPGTEDNIIVTATSKTDPSVKDNGNCVVRSIAIIRGVEVSISPAEKEGMPGVELSYTVEVTNTGNITDVYDLTVSDNAVPSWGPSLSENTLEVPAGGNGTTTLSATVPENTSPDTEDEITVVVTSRENDAVTSSASCVGRSLILVRVEVRISPSYRDGPPEATLYYTVTVSNTGQAADVYNLHVTASTGWFPDIEPSSLTLDPGESDNATLSITIPSNISNGDSGIMEVRAISTVNSEVEGVDTCRVVVVVEEGVLSMNWVQIILIAAVMAGVVFAAGYLLRGRRGGRKGSRRRKGSRK